jgi:hypothetical protein
MNVSSTSPADPAGQHSTGHSAKFGKGLALISTAMVALVAGIVLGNAARKRVDRWTHGYH